MCFLLINFCKLFVCLDFLLLFFLYCIFGCVFFFVMIFLAHLCRKLVGEIIEYPCSGVRPSSTISNMTISATSGPITMKLYQKRHWAGEKTALGFGPDRIKTLS